MIMDPMSFLVAAPIVCAALGLFLSSRCEPSKAATFDGWGVNTLQTAEAVDAVICPHIAQSTTRTLTPSAMRQVLDIIVWWATDLAGDFGFANDPNRMMAWAAWLVASFSMAAFLLETLLGSYCNFEGSLRMYVRYVIALHVMLEDGFQMLLYTLVGSSQTRGDVSVSAGLGALQCILFFFVKLREVWNFDRPRSRSRSGVNDSATQDTVML